jgi:hypothetical protein
MRTIEGSTNTLNWLSADLLGSTFIEGANQASFEIAVW